MKYIVFTILFSLLAATAFSQSKKESNYLCYAIKAPDDSIAITIYDDSIGNFIKLDSKEDFYKVNLLDIATNKVVYRAKNKGNQCVIDKSKLLKDSYKIRLFTKDFIITAKINFASSSKLISSKNTGLLVLSD